QVKINYLNVCTPSDEEKQELSAALNRVPLKAGFAPDFEVSRGRTTMPGAPAEVIGTEPRGSAGAGSISSWVRVRREYPPEAAFVSVQYSMSVDPKNIVETLVFRLRDLKDVIQISLEDSVSSATDPSQVLKIDTPVDRIRIERFGKSSVVLARCAAADQKNYDLVFQKGSQVMQRYRTLLAVRQTVPADLRRLGIHSEETAGKPALKKPVRKPA